MNELKYTQVALQEKFGSMGAYGITVNISSPRPLSQAEVWDISNVSEEILNNVMSESIRLDPLKIAARMEEKEKLLGLFSGGLIYVEEIPNGYCNDWYLKHNPWFIVTTAKGRIKIGWRKRVINIDWSDSIIKRTGKELFPSEDTTVCDSAIHAWGYEKAKEYINRLLNA